VVRSNPEKRGRLLVGTSGWSYDDWIGRFYPEGLDRKDWLAAYARQFPAVELNVTFYRVPFENMIRGWNRRAPDGFVFAAKGNRVVTHRLRLREVEQEVSRFYERMQALRGLEVVLWQLPPSLRCDAGLLEEFLQVLPTGWRRAIEFRHRSWWEDPAVVRALSRHNSAFCGVSHPRLPAATPRTADFTYVRFHGLGPRLYDYEYSETELHEWIGRTVEDLADGRDAYVFFNNDFRANAVQNARMFRRLVLERLGDRSTAACDP